MLQHPKLSPELDRVSMFPSGCLQSSFPFWQQRRPTVATPGSTMLFTLFWGGAAKFTAAAAVRPVPRQHFAAVRMTWKQLRGEIQPGHLQAIRSQNATKPL